VPRFVAHKKYFATIRQEVSPLEVDLGRRQRSGRPCAGWKEHKLVPELTRDTQNPLGVKGKRSGSAVAQSNRRRAIRLTQVNSAEDTSGLTDSSNTKSLPSGERSRTAEKSIQESVSAQNPVSECFYGDFHQLRVTGVTANRVPDHVGARPHD
jgi:hypothetical protein